MLSIKHQYTLVYFTYTGKHACLTVPSHEHQITVNLTVCSPDCSCFLCLSPPFSLSLSLSLSLSHTHRHRHETHTHNFKPRISGPLCAVSIGRPFQAFPCHGPLVRYVKLRVAHAPGMAGTFPPAADFEGNRQLAISACITARASRTCRDACRDRLPAVAGETIPAFPAHAHPQFYVFGKRPIEVIPNGMGAVDRYQYETPRNRVIVIGDLLNSIKVMTFWKLIVTVGSTFLFGDVYTNDVSYVIYELSIRVWHGKVWSRRIIIMTDLDTVGQFFKEMIWTIQN